MSVALKAVKRLASFQGTGKSRLPGPLEPGESRLPGVQSIGGLINCLYEKIL